MENAKKIIERIKEEKLEPTPKWMFISGNVLIWSAFALTILFGAMAFSVILFAIQQTDFNIISHLSHSRLELLLGILPFIWLILVIIFLILAMLSLRYSRRGYKFSLFKLVSLSLLISVALGTLFFLAGGSGRLEKIFDINVLTYESIEERKIQIWSNPDQGFLAGTILEEGTEVMRLRDFAHEEWQVTLTDAFIAPIVMLEPGEVIKIIGQKTGPNNFKAEEIRPWGGRGGRPGNRGMGKNHPPGRE